MAEEPNLGSGGMGGSMRDVRSRFAVDTSQMDKLVKGFSAVKKDLEWMNKNLDATIAKVNKLAVALSKVNASQVNTSTTSPANNTTGAVNSAIQTTANLVANNNAPTPTAPTSPTTAGGGGFFKNFRGAIGGMVGGAAGNFIAQGTQMIDQRADAGYGAALAADRMGVLYQQMYGITNNQYANQFRRPLQGAMLGAGGINTLLGLQARTGLSAQGMAPGVEALRAASGFSLSTENISQLIQTLASPMVNNRLTMTMGTGIYGPMGSQRNPMQVVQQIVRGAGLTNERIVNSGMQQGSVTRARLTAMGVPEDMQDLVLQYAQENIQYQKRSGNTGQMYDPGSAEQRKLMGIDKNFALEKEVTDVRRAERDEQFYRRQADNYAALERNTQKLIDTFAALEDRLSGIIGARISTRGNPLTKFLGGAMALGGIALAPWSGGSSLALTAVGGAMMAGDGTPDKSRNKNASVPTGTSGKKTSFKDLENNPAFARLNPKFKERLLRMMQDNPNVGIGQGYRSAADQRRMFLERYTRTSENTGTFWDGSFWKKNANVPDAAPPGLSMHEIGLAADLTGDLDWVQKNAAKYGLQTFADVNNEPWHVQPAELPRGRSAYEKAGSPWGTEVGGNSFDPEAMFNGVRGGGIITDSTYGSGSSRAITTMSQMSLADQIAFAKEANRGIVGRVSGGGTVSAFGADKTGKKKTISGSVVGLKTLNRKGVPYQIPDRRFTRADWDAIAQVETGGNWKFVNGSKVFRGGLAMHSGVWDTYGGREFARWAERATPEEQIIVAQRSSFDGYTDPKTGKFIPPAGIGGFESVHKNAIKWPNVKSGDGAPSSPVRSSGNIRIDGGNNITIAPNIYFQSSGNSQADAHRAAKEVSRMITEELRIAAMRAS